MSEKNKPQVAKDERKAYSVDEMPAAHLGMLETSLEEMQQDRGAARAEEAKRDDELEQGTKDECR
jgi:hypothetical protein